MTTETIETRRATPPRVRRRGTTGGASPQHRRPVAADLADLLNRIVDLDLGGLQQAWTVWLPGPVPPIRSAVVLRRLLAWRIQAAVHGGYDAAIARALKRLIADHRADRPLTEPSRSRLAPGTVLRREWKGSIHAVTVETAGFRYEDRCYASLSEIARRITGTRWSGPRLFGLDAPVAAKRASRTS